MPVGQRVTRLCIVIIIITIDEVRIIIIIIIVVVVVFRPDRAEVADDGQKWTREAMQR